MSLRTWLPGQRTRSIRPAAARCRPGLDVLISGSSGRSRRLSYRPALEILEDRRLLTPGAFIEDFSNDANPANPGFDSSGAFLHVLSSPSSFLSNVSNQPPAVAASPSPPHVLLLTDRDTITFAGVGLGETVTRASVSFHTTDATGRVVIQGTTGPRTFDLPTLMLTDAWQTVSATSTDLGDDGQPLGPITAVTLHGNENLFDQVTIEVTGALPANNPPDAVDDIAGAVAGVLAVVNVLANDTIAPDTGETLTITAFTQGSQGTVALTSTGTHLAYLITSSFQGTDTFTYTVSDGNGGTDTATVTVTITAPPPLPPGATLIGQKFDDRNANGARDAGEPALNGWFIKLLDPASRARWRDQITHDIDLNGDGTIDPETERGLYRFAGIAPGTYLVEEGPQNGWTQTFPAGVTRLVSAAAQGGPANGHSFHPAPSSDGAFVVFESDADNLVPGDTNGARDVFLHDRQTGVIERISVDRTGRQADGPSYHPTISLSGQFIAFVSEARNLVPRPGLPGVPQVYLVDRVAGTIVRVSVGAGEEPGNAASLAPALSPSGATVVFQSDATNLVPGDTNGVSDVFVYDRERQTTRRVSAVDRGLFGFGTQADGASADPVINEFGIAFESLATNLVAGDTNRRADVFFVALSGQDAGIPLRVSVTAAGEQRPGDSYDPAFSSNSTYVAYVSEFTDPFNGNAFRKEIFLHQLYSNRSERITELPTGVKANGHSHAPALSFLGDEVLFQSEASNLVAGDTNGQPDLFLYDRRAQQLVRVPVGALDGPSLDPVFIGRRSLVFASYASGLVPGDTNGAADVFVYDGGVHQVTVQAGEQVTGLDFGNHEITPGTFRFSAASYSVRENEAVATITVRRSGGADGRLVVPYTVRAGSASARPILAADFVGADGALVFFAGETVKTFTVRIVNDRRAEANETVRLKLFSPSGGPLDAALLTIVDNDGRPGLGGRRPKLTQHQVAAAKTAQPIDTRGSMRSGLGIGNVRSWKRTPIGGVGRDWFHVEPDGVYFIMGRIRIIPWDILLDREALESVN